MALVLSVFADVLNMLLELCCGKLPFQNQQERHCLSASIVDFEQIFVAKFLLESIKDLIMVYWSLTL